MKTQNKKNEWGQKVVLWFWYCRNCKDMSDWADPLERICARCGKEMEYMTVKDMKKQRTGKKSLYNIVRNVGWWMERSGRQEEE